MSSAAASSNAAMLKHYRMNDLFPEAWEEPTPLPSETRPTSGSGRPISASGIQRTTAHHHGHGHGHGRQTSASRYSVLQEEGGYKPMRSSSNAGGSHLSLPGIIEANVPQDEPDPLGTSHSVVKVLRDNGVNDVDMNLRFRNRYLISSKTFAPSEFLRDVHTHTSAQELQSGLDHLSASISQKSSALKLLVSNNFDRFVLAKSTIDAVYEEMKMGTSTSAREHLTEGDEGEAFDDPSKGTFRLTKEDEWGLRSIRAPLTEAGVQAGIVFGPVLENQGREERLRVLLAVMDRYRSTFELSSLIVDAIKRKDYEALKEEYFRAKKTVESARAVASNGRSPSEGEIHRIIVAERMWAEVEEVIEEYKRDTWRRLVDTSQSENFLDLITVLLELGVQDNPIWVWLLSRYDYLKKKISVQFERSRVEIEVLRRRLAAANPATLDVIAHHLRTPTRPNPDVYDTPLVTAFWELLQSSLSSFLSPTDGLVGEVMAFWVTAQNFIDGKTQKTLPLGPDDASSKTHHRLSEDGVTQLRKGGMELVSMIIQNITEFFMNNPIDDISSLVSPLPPLTPEGSAPGTPTSAAPRTPVSASISSHFMLNRKELPATPGDNYAFLAPHSNSLGGTHYLALALGLLGTAAVELSKLPIGKPHVESLRTMISGARERAIHATCISWLKDSKDCKVLEDWTRASDNRDITKMPGLFLSVEGAILLGMQDVLYVNKAKVDPSNQVIIPPSKSLIAYVRQHFVKSLYVALHGMIENAKSSRHLTDSDSDIGELTSPITAVAPASIMAFSVDKRDSNVRMLLTLSNLQTLRTVIVPQLISQFETAFSLTLTDETASIKDSLLQIDKQLFDAYTKPHAETLQKLVSAGVAAPNWEPTGRALDVKPYIHDCLLSLVLVHAQVVTTATTLLPRIISHLLESLSRDLLLAFKTRGGNGAKFSLSALLQATLDIEFVNQTLSQYNTDVARGLLQEIYVELDRRSDGPARTALQRELSDLRTVLTGLRRGTRAEFLCFRMKKSRPV